MRASHESEHAASAFSRSLPHVWAVAWRLLATLLALEFVYFTLANLALSTPLLRKFATSDDISVRYDWAYSLWPGRIVVKNLRLRVQDHNIQFLVGIERGSLDVSLHELVSKRFHALRVDADNVSYRMRHKVSRVGKEGPRLAAYPPIEGFSDPPLFDGPPSPPIPDDDYHLWDVRVEDVTAKVKEIWILEYRYLGPGVARGNFHVKPARWYEVYPASLELDGGKVTLGGAEVARNADVMIDCRVEGSDTRKLSGMAPFSKIHGGVRGRFAGTNLAFLDAYLGPHAGLSATGDAEVLLNARIERGVVVPGSSIELRTSAMTVGNSELRVDGAPTYRVSVPAGAEGAPLELGVRARRLVLNGRSERHAAPRVEHVDARLKVTPDLSQPLELVAVDLAPLELSLPDLGWISAFDDDLPALGGHASGQLELHRDGRGRWTGKSEADAPAVRVQTQKVEFTGEARATASLERAPASDTIDFSRVRLELPRAVLTADGRTTRPWSAVVQSSKLELRPDSDKKRASGTVDVHADDASGLLPLFVDSPIARRIEAALLGLKALDARAAFTLGDVSRVDLLRAQAGIAKARGMVTLTRDGPTGAFLVSTGPANLGVRVRSGETRVEVFVGNDWLDKQFSRKPQ